MIYAKIINFTFLLVDLVSAIAMVVTEEDVVDVVNVTYDPYACSLYISSFPSLNSYLVEVILS